MKRPVLFLAVAGAVLAVALLGAQKKSGLLLLEWAGKAPAEKHPVAVLIELGLKDDKPTPWSGTAAVRGARVAHREGYRFRDGDKLTTPDGWTASSHRAVRVGPNARPAIRLAKMNSVGVVLHLQDVHDAHITLEAGEGDNKKKAEVALADVLAGKTHVLWEGKAAVRRVSASAPLVTARTEDDFPAAAYGPDGALWLAYVSYKLKEERRRAPLQQIDEQPDNFKDYDTPEYGDQLFVRRRRDGKWGEPLAVTGPHEDLVRCAVGVEGGGRVWVVYSAHRGNNFDLYARPVEGGKGEPQLGPEQRLTRDNGRNLTPVLCTDQAGRLHLACQSWDKSGTARIRLLTCDDGKWSAGPTLPAPATADNRWYPALAAGPDGQVAVAYDFYKDGDYDVEVAVVEGGRVKTYPVARSPRFEARPSLAYDAAGRLWIAYEEGPENWGKDFGALDRDRGNPLYAVRSVRVACLAGGKLFRPADQLPTSASKQKGPNNITPRYAFARLGLDGKGRLWLAYRQRVPSVFGTQPGTYWLSFARRLDGDHWSEPVQVHHSDGLLDSRPVLLPDPAGGLLVLTNSDGRYVLPNSFANDIYQSYLDLPGEAAEPKLVPHEPGEKRADERGERAAVRRLRTYRLEAGDKKYQLLRGEFHRHTEISFDGGSDGALEDMWRYAIDVASLDWIGNTDHDSGAGREYPWWLIQKSTDAYHVPGAFTPMFAYERSVQYPMGHRNCIFPRRGIRTLPRLKAAGDKTRAVGNIHVDDTKMLYRYLRNLGGICASHTSATSMGTDWRDNDPELEPVVEIYQGDRNNYEMEGAPRAGYDPKSGKKPVNIAGWYPKGYINLALGRGIRLGFQSSSDHISTHISYCIALAEEESRPGIVAALRKRHSYAATDNILLEVRSGDRIMGDEFKTKEAPAVRVRVTGTGPLARVEVLRDSEVVATFKPLGAEYQGSWTDPKPEKGLHYYYVRVQQSDGELAWSSPLWVDYAP